VSAPARQVVIFTVEAVGTVDADLPEGTLAAFVELLEASTLDELTGFLNGVTVSATWTTGKSGASS